MNCPTCVECLREMKPAKTGVAFIESLANGEPYKLWMADMAECRGCGKKVLYNYARSPVAEHFQPDFKEKCDRYQVAFSVACP